MTIMLNTMAGIVAATAFLVIAPAVGISGAAAMALAVGFGIAAQLAWTYSPLDDSTGGMGMGAPKDQDWGWP